MSQFWGPLYRQTTEPLFTDSFDVEEAAYIAYSFRGDLPPGNILDIGCGIGRHIPYVRKLTGRKVIGLDIDATAIADARAKGCDAMQCDIANMPFPDASIAGAYSWRNVPYFLAKELRTKALGEVARVLKPEGRFVVQVYTKETAQQHAQIPIQEMEIPTGSIQDEVSFGEDDCLSIKRTFTRRSDGAVLKGNCEIYCLSPTDIVKEMALSDMKVRSIRVIGLWQIVTAERI